MRSTSPIRTDLGEPPRAGSDRVRLVVASVVVAGLVAAVVRGLLLGPLTVSSASMEPTLRAGERIWVSWLAPDPDELVRGRLVVFEEPGGGLSVKRVVGLPGEEVVVLDGVLHVDGVAVAETWLDHDTVDGYFSSTYRVPSDHVFVMGDNRGNSIDSRDYGSIGSDDLRGVVLSRAP